MRNLSFGLLFAATIAGFVTGCQPVTTDPAALVNLAVDHAQIDENGGRALVTATLDRPCPVPVEVYLSFDGTAVAGVDYTHSNNKIIIPIGATRGSVRIWATPDATPDGDRTIEIAIADVAGAAAGAAQQASVTIVDRIFEGTPTVNLLLRKANALSTHVALADPQDSVELIARASHGFHDGITVQLDFAGDVAETDYTATAGEIAIPAGQVDGSITIAANPEGDFEGGWWLLTTIASIEGAEEATPDGARQQVTVTSADLNNKQQGEMFLTLNANAPGIQTTASGLQYRIEQEGTGPKPGPNDIVDVIYTGSLLDGTQFDTSEGQTRSFNVDGLIAGWTEALQLMPVGSKWTLYIPASLGYGSQEQPNIPADSMLIFDVELVGTTPPPTVTLSLDHDSIPEDAGVATVTATLSTSADQDVTVTLAFAGTATNTTDYTRSGDQIVIPAGQTSGSITITAVQDDIYEGDETVIVEVDTVTGAVEDGTQQVTVTIIEDDAWQEPTISLGLAPDGQTEQRTHVALPDPFTSINLIANASHPDHQGITVLLDFSGGDADPTDYTASATEITIPTGQTSGSITIAPDSVAGFEAYWWLLVKIASISGGHEMTGNGVKHQLVAVTSADLNDLQQGELFLAMNANVEGVEITQSGLQYEIFQQGDGPIPGPTDTVEAIYRGTLVSGMQFDSSDGQPVEFDVDGVIAGWTEALQLMPVGSRWKLYIPEDLAYGDQAVGSIPPNSALIFEVELVGIVGNP